jgi:hypothetical protein
MRIIACFLLITLASCTGSIGWDTHGIKVDATENEPIKEKAS